MESETNKFQPFSSVEKKESKTFREIIFPKREFKILIRVDFYNFLPILIKVKSKLIII